MLREAPDRFRPESRDALEDFTIRGAFPRQAIHDSACPLKTPIVNCHPPRDFAHRTSDCRLRFTLRLTPVAFAPPRGFLFEGRDACLARMLSRGFSSVGLGPRPPAPLLTLGNQLCWTVAARRLLQLRFDVRAHSRVPSSSPGIAAVISCEITPLSTFAWRPPPKRRAVRSEPKRSDSQPTPSGMRPRITSEAGLWDPSLARRKPGPSRADRAEPKVLLLR